MPLWTTNDKKSQCLSQLWNSHTTAQLQIEMFANQITLIFTNGHNMGYARNGEH